VTTAEQHLARHLKALLTIDCQQAKIEALGATIAERLLGGGRLLAAGNGGSAALAQHLTAELVGRYRTERVPLSAIALHAETSSLTAIANDYGYRQAMARQVQAHGRPGDVLVTLSTSGSSPNLLCAVEAGRDIGLLTVAFTGATPNPLAARSELSIAIPADTTAVIQEVHLLAIHLLCEVVDTIASSGEAEPETVA
jgi:D-sedoheptulose 7-phosphate isomerase